MYMHVVSTRTWTRWFLTNPIYRAAPYVFDSRGTLVAGLLQKQQRTLGNHVGILIRLLQSSEYIYSSSIRLDFVLHLACITVLFHL